MQSAYFYVFAFLDISLIEQTLHTLYSNAHSNRRTRNRWTTVTSTVNNIRLFRWTGILRGILCVRCIRTKDAQGLARRDMRHPEAKGVTEFERRNQCNSYESVAPIESPRFTSCTSSIFDKSFRQVGTEEHERHGRKSLRTQIHNYS